MSSYATLDQLGCTVNLSTVTPKDDVVENFSTSEECGHYKQMCNGVCMFSGNRKECVKHCMRDRNCKTEHYEDDCETTREKCRTQCWGSKEQWPCQVECMKDHGCSM